MTGLGGGHDIELRQLAAQGLVLLGRVAGAESGKLSIADDLRSNIPRGDESLVAFNRRCDDVVRDQSLDLPPAPPPAHPWPEPTELQSPIRSRDLAREGVTSVILAHGAVTDFSWIDLPVFGNPPGPKPMPLHQRGITTEPGLYFLGLPWLHKWKLAFLLGADEAYLAGHIVSGNRPDRTDR